MQSTGKEYCEAVIARTVERFGGVDILLNNAGIIPRGTIEETTDEMWFTAMDVNLNAVFFLCRSAIPHMKQRGGGAIVNTSSVWGTYPGHGHVAYCTSKGAVAALSKSSMPDPLASPEAFRAWLLDEKGVKLVSENWNRE